MNPLSLSLLWLCVPVNAQIDPGMHPGLAILLDGDLVGSVTIEAWSRPTATAVGTEHWSWRAEPWPDATLVLEGSDEAVGGTTVAYEQALLPVELEPWSGEGERTYRLWRAGEPIGWLVVDDLSDPRGTLTWLVEDGADVGALVELEAEALVLEPVEAAPAGDYRTVTQRGS